MHFITPARVDLWYQQLNSLEGFLWEKIMAEISRTVKAEIQILTKKKFYPKTTGKIKYRTELTTIFITD